MYTHIHTQINNKEKRKVRKSEYNQCSGCVRIYLIVIIDNVIVRTVWNVWIGLPEY